MADITQSIHEKVILNIVNRAFCNKDVIKCVNDIKKFNNEVYLHSIRVALLSLEVGIASGKKALELEEIFITGFLHDYGKLFIPESILCKKNSLTPEERAIIELHPSAGFLGLKRNTNLPDKITYAVLDHHEKEDCSGYGAKKNSKSIVSYARLIAPVDIYEAMISDRVYRKAIDQKTVISFLSCCAGRSLNNEYVSQLIDFVSKNSVDDFLNKYTVLLSNLHDDYMKSNIEEASHYHIM